MNHTLYCSICASNACHHTQRHRQRQKNATRDAAEFRRLQIARKLLITAVILAAFTGSGYACFAEYIGWRWTHNNYTRADWIESYTDNRHVINTRWYIGDACPLPYEKGGFPSNLYGNDHRARGIYSTEGYICLQDGMKPSPRNPTALHELAHAVAWETQRYADHGETFQDILEDVEQHYRWQR